MKAKRGFALMDKDKQRRIASMGGKKAHALGKAHEWTHEEGKILGPIAGKISAGKRKFKS